MRTPQASRILAFLLAAACAHGAAAQGPWRGLAGFGLTHSPAPAPVSGPLAVLVRHPAPAPGDPPYALADNRGVVRRLVEPTPGIDLAPYVGRVIRVAHDTGGTLLASQLDLPPDPSALPGPIDAAVLPAAAAGPRPSLRVAQATAEPLPEPIVLEEVIGAPAGPAPAAAPAPPAPLRFPSVVAPQAAGGPDHGGPFAGGVAWSPGGRRRSPLDFGAELLLLRAHDSAAINGGDDFDTGSRWSLGYDAGFGRRLGLRYFDFATGQQQGSLDVEVIDLEFERHFLAGPRADWSLSGGLRWAEFGETAGLSYSDTIGPVLGARARAPALGRIDGVLSVRQSFQFGDASLGGGEADRGTFSISELQLGLERRFPLRAGEGFVRGAFETQYWNDVGRSDGTNSSRGLIGFGLGVGVAR